MSQYAIVKLGSSQHKVSIEDIVVTDRLDKSVGDKFSMSEVYLLSDGEDFIVGTPTVGTEVEFEVVSHGKGEKIRIHKFKAKSRYHKTTGFRAFQTTLKVLSIGGLKEVAPKAEKKTVESAPKKEAKSSKPAAKAAKK